MIGHGVYRYKFLIFIRDDACDVFVKFFFVFPVYQRFSAIYGENDLNIDLGVGISHDGSSCDDLRACFENSPVEKDVSIRNQLRQELHVYSKPAPAGRNVYRTAEPIDSSPSGAI
jgi:hypothetical protein